MLWFFGCLQDVNQGEVKGSDNPVPAAAGEVTALPG